MKKTMIIAVTLFAWYSVSLGADAPKDSLKAVPRKGPPPAVSVANHPQTPDTTKATGTIDSAAVTTKTGFARLNLRSQPDSAAIVIDSTEKGPTPARIDSLSPGQHVILIKKKGYFVKKITTTLFPDSLHDLSVVLVKPGCLAVKSEPAGAAVYLDNKETGVTPYENAKLKPGAYALRLELAKHETVERSVTVAETGCDTLFISLPLSKAYTDSIDRAHKAAAKKKSKFKKTVDIIAIGAFLVFGAVIFFIELGNAD
jgi:hypothetical protein